MYNAIIERRRSDKNDEHSKKVLDNAQKAMRGEIVEIFKSHDDWKYIGKDHKKFIEDILPDFIAGSAYRKDAIAVFKRFTTYFTGFHENRANMYSSKDQASAISYRIVHENFGKFIDNLPVYALLQQHCNDELTAVEESLSSVLDGLRLDDVFCLDYFNHCLTQGGIDKYNTIIGAFTNEAGDKIQGINEIGNLYLQQNPSSSLKRSQLKMKPLFKQILSDRETYSFVPDKFNNESEIVNSINDYRELLRNESLDGMVELISKLGDCDNSKIYICGANITKFSQLLFGRWSTLGEALKQDAVYGAKKKADKDKDIEAWIDNKWFTLEDIIKISDTILLEDREKVDVLSCLNTKIEELKRAIEEKSELFNFNTDEDEQDSRRIRGSVENTEIVKNLLDSYNNMFHFIKLFHLGKDSDNFDKDETFYSVDFERWYSDISLIVRLYNKVRNYMASKPADEDKMVLKFGNSTLADGWDKNKEADNGVVILLKDNKYYIAIMSPERKGANKSFENIPMANEGEEVYKKMRYKLLPGPNKMLPKVFFSEKGIQAFDPPQNILDGYKAELHKKERGNIDFCRQLIDFYKDAINRHVDWREFGFDFRETSKYDDISAFYKDVETQGYKMTFDDVPVSYIDSLISTGSIYLFQIYNKDFAEGSTGKLNMHTLYWKAIFSDANLRDVVFKLNGEAELFYRKGIIRQPVVHRKGSMLVNRRCSDGEIIPNDIYRELYEYYNNIDNRTGLSEKAEQYNDRVVVKRAKCDIVKDKRYTNYKFLFHVPITINFKAGQTNKFNDRTNNTFRDYERDINIIGLDRGERNLIYLTLIDKRGNILEQRSFNSVETVRHDGITTKFDYHKKLDQVEADRDAARKNWNTIENIKELKEGYLSQVVHQITKMMVDKNAIVVMEDLNFGFKRGRFKVEKQIYQKFEKMLIDKLNYLVFKDKETGCGSLLKGLQLSAPFESFKSMGKQMGWIYYVPAGYTSKICPKTGFVNVFKMTDVTNGDGRKKFFSKMDKIVYNSTDNLFEFSFDYKKFDTYQTMYRTKWTVCTNDIRIEATKNDNTWTTSDVDLTESMKNLLNGRAIGFERGEDIKKAILHIDSSDASFYKGLFRIFMLSMQMRNSIPNSNTDYIVSPVRDEFGKFFDSRNANNSEPKDADANGAYHIALKGLMLLDKIKGDSKDLIIKNADWFKFRQSQVE